MADERDGFDGLSRWFGMRWEAHDRLRVTIRPELINAAGLLSGMFGVGGGIVFVPALVIFFDLNQVDYVGSVFLSFLLRCHKRVKEHGSEVVVAGASQKARELLHMTALDTLWALYNTRKEALAALSVD